LEGAHFRPPLTGWKCRIDRQEATVLELIPTMLADVFILEPKIFGDERGFFLEAYNEATFRKLGLPTRFMQDNHSGSRKGVLRGLHYQLTQPQGKLVRCLRGSIFDVAVDLRQGSVQYGKWFGTELSAENKRMLWIPPGFGHGFLVLSEFAEVSYKATNVYSPASERSILWNDPAIGINWPLEGEPTLSEKDRAGVLLVEAETYIEGFRLDA
jgi:dTDP-4-dehydrorhamnose 3,5-epimerase